jgi:hypothetical protein
LRARTPWPATGAGAGSTAGSSVVPSMTLSCLPPRTSQKPAGPA